jgi:serine/threonine-protein kinase
MVRDVAEILEHAHRRGVVHCDLRPDRIVITGSTRGYPLCIRDWSEARVHDTSASLPELDVREYAAPELLDGTGIDDRADVFSLGTIAYRALTGTLPLRGRLVPTAVRCPEVPPELTGLVDAMIADERFDRPSSAEVNAQLILLVRDLAAPGPTGMPTGIRIRRPRWTPSLPADNGSSDLAELDTVVTDEPHDKSS